MKNEIILFENFRNQAREAEPKDYDINKAPMRDLGKATYHRIGNVTDGVSQHHSRNCNLYALKLY